MCQFRQSITQTTGSSHPNLNTHIFTSDKMTQWGLQTGCMCSPKMVDLCYYHETYIRVCEIAYGFGGPS